MAKVDLRKEFAQLYYTGARAKEPHLVDVPPLQYAMIDGAGDPNTSEDFRKATGALYAVAYSIKFAARNIGSEFGVMPLEGLWWTDPPEAFSMDDKSMWSWTLMILQPELVSTTMVDCGLASALDKGKIDSETAAKVRLEALREGSSAQVLHLGPYADEAPTVAGLHAFVEASGHRLRGKHHEIYMNDPRRVAPERMKTLLRHPVEKA